MLNPEPDSSYAMELDLASRAKTAGLRIEAGMHLFPSGLCTRCRPGEAAEVLDTVTGTFSLAQEPLANMLCPGVQGMALAQLEARYDAPITISKGGEALWFGRWGSTVVRGGSRAEVVVKLLEVIPCP